MLAILLAQSHAAYAQAAVIAPPNAVFVPEQPTNWLSAVAQVGFPIVMSSWLLYIFDKRLLKLIQKMEQISEIMRIRPPEEESEK